ncbi:MAG TPA: 3-phosphoshikimate 1-carboxyvinyltransferase [Vicinamibacteria bacterium]|nr:3-phosphoshikimate 1-carboxyvinyltransferase [Vicinamibacteria bacterium]
MTARTKLRLRGRIDPPGDKSIGHRLAFLAAISRGRSRLEAFPPGRDCASTLELIRTLGVQVNEEGSSVTIIGRGLGGLVAPHSDLDAGNSGSTARMATGLLAGQSFDSRIVGDSSLSRRPFDRVVNPLTEMGGVFETTDGRLPLRILGGHPLHGISYTLPVPSAQVKTAVLFAGLFASGRTTVRESTLSRNHTEIGLAGFGIPVVVANGTVSIEGGRDPIGNEFRLPGDFSSAAFFVGAAASLPGSDLVVRGVGLNPTRTGLLRALRAMDADVEWEPAPSPGGEPMGTIRVRGRELHGFSLDPSEIPTLIDEIPILAVVAAFAEGPTRLEGLGELRVKESDRLYAIQQGLRALGVRIEPLESGIVIHGGPGELRPARLRSYGDHRMVMAWAIASLGVGGDCEIDHLDQVKISYPGFWETLDRLLC